MVSGSSLALWKRIQSLDLHNGAEKISIAVKSAAMGAASQAPPHI